MTPHDDAFGIAKAYTPGTITYHQEQAGIHARKKASAKRRASVGLAGIGLSAAAAGALDRKAPTIAHYMAAPGADLGSRARTLSIANHTYNLRYAARMGGAAGVIGGAAIAGQGALSAVHHGGQQNASARRAQQARLQRNSQIAKAMPFASGVRNLGAAANQAVRRGSARRTTTRALRPLGEQAPPMSGLARRARFKGKVN